MAIERIDYELCRGCGVCVKICPVDVFRMDEKRKQAVIMYPEDCMLCEFCVMDCPDGAIFVSPEKNLVHTLSWG